MKTRLIVSVVLALVLIGGYVYWQRMGDSSYAGGSSAATVPPPITLLTEPVPMDVLSQHSTASSCWSAIDGNIYDLTGWISQHPGGERAIEQLCGKDGTVAFHGQHKDNKRQADILVGFKIGTLRP